MQRPIKQRPKQSTQTITPSSNPTKFPSTMKPKYLLQPKKQPLQYSHNNNPTSKILLTDLCPQQKAKIGQLIKTLEQRKKQNQQLTQQLQTWRSNYIGVDRARQELEGKLGERERDVERLEGELERLEGELVEKGVEVEGARLEREGWEERRRGRVSVGTSMEVKVEMSDQATQTKEKKKKLKETQVQVNTINQLGGIQQRQTKKNNFYQPNSKSFDRIMKGDRLAVSNYQTAVFREGDREREEREEGEIDNDEVDRQLLTGTNRNYVALSSNRHPTSNADPFTHRAANDNIPKLRASQLQDPYDPQHQQSSPPHNKNWSQYQESSYRQNNNPLKLAQQQIQVQDTQNDDDEFQMLARKWMQLKERNIQQLTRGEGFGGGDDDESQLNLLNNNGNNNSNNATHYMRSDDLIRSLGLQSQSQSQSKQSIRVKGVSGNNDRKHKRNPIHQEEQDSGLVDEEMLNRALKGRDFSASRLLNNSRSRRNTEEESGGKVKGLLGDSKGRRQGDGDGDGYRNNGDQKRGSGNNNGRGNRQDEGRSASNINNTNNKPSSKPSLAIRQQNTTNTTNKPSKFGASKTRNPITQSQSHDNNNKNQRQNNQKMDFYSPDLLDLVEEMNR